MTTLTKIGNSQGIRIPKTLILQAHLENTHLELEVLENGLLIKPINNISRKNWTLNISQTLQKNSANEDEAFLEDMLNDSDLEDYQW